MCATVMAAERSVTSSSTSSTYHAALSAFIPYRPLPLQSIPLKPARCNSPIMKETVTVIGASTSVGRRLAAELLKAQDLSVNLCFDKYSDAVCHAGNPAARCFVGNLAQTRNELKVLQVTSTGDNRLVNLDTVLQSSELIVISEYTSCFPSLDWLLGKSPKDVNVKMVRNVVNGCGSSLRKLVFLSALGAKRKLSKLPKLDANILFWCPSWSPGRT